MNTKERLSLSIMVLIIITLFLFYVLNIHFGSADTSLLLQ